MRGFPIVCRFGVDVDGNREVDGGLGGFLHHPAGHLDEIVRILALHLEDELVMHLQQHASR